MPDSGKRVLDVVDGNVPNRVLYFELLISDGVTRQMRPGPGYLDFREKERIDMVFSKGSAAAKSSVFFRERPSITRGI